MVESYIRLVSSTISSNTNGSICSSSSSSTVGWEMSFECTRPGTYRTSVQAFVVAIGKAFVRAHRGDHTRTGAYAPAHPGHVFPKF